MSHLAGSWPALMTPRQADGRPNQKALRALVRYLLQKEISGFYVNGSSGEGIYMSVEERELVLEVSLDEIAGAVAAPDAFRLARHAQEAGAAGTASIVPPLYQSMEAITAYYRQLASCTPDLPFFMYIFGPIVPALALVQESLDIPNLMGGKYTGPDMFEFARSIGGGSAPLGMVSLLRDGRNVPGGGDGRGLREYRLHSQLHARALCPHSVSGRARTLPGGTRAAKRRQSGDFGPHRPRFHRFPLRSHADAGHRQRQSAFAPYRIECNAGKVAAG